MSMDKSIEDQISDKEQELKALKEQLMLDEMYARAKQDGDIGNVKLANNQIQDFELFSIANPSGTNIIAQMYINGIKCHHTITLSHHEVIGMMSTGGSKAIRKISDGISELVMKHIFDEALNREISQFLKQQFRI